MATLVLAAIAINLVHVSFFKSQRLKRIDQQIFGASQELVRSAEFQETAKATTDIDEGITRILKGSRIGKVFIVRDVSGRIAFQSFNAALLKAELPLSPEWVTVTTDSEYVRVRNLPMPGRPGSVLQVGMALDRNFLNWEIVDNRVITYIAGIVLSLFLVSVALTLVLLSPLRMLVFHLTEATSSLTDLKDVKPLPENLRQHADGFWSKSDEFSSLLTAVQRLIDRINVNYKLTRSWTVQMAHELKTPLAIIQAETESKMKAGLLPDTYGKGVVSEVEQMSETISQFLDWAELENSLMQKDLYAQRMQSVVKGVAARLDKLGQGRIELSLKADFQVFANPMHLDQLISNLLTNALKFSNPEERVFVEVGDCTLTVRDRGAGIPKQVLDRLGQPFNIGSNRRNQLRGNGLGLAWVSTVTKRYQWDLKIKSSESGSEITISFPAESASS